MNKKSYCCNAQVEYELWICDRNPDGVVPEPYEHGNEYDGEITCDDEYCNPNTIELDFIPSYKYYLSHECHSRCTKCDGLTGD